MYNTVFLNRIVDAVLALISHNKYFNPLSKVRPCCVHVRSLQSCPTLCNPMDCSLPGCLVPGILEARILEWVATPFSRRSSQPRGWTYISSFFCTGRQILYRWRHLGSPLGLPMCCLICETSSAFSPVHYVLTPRIQL